MADILTWNLEELRNLATRKYGLVASKHLDVYLESVSKKINIAAYHSLESRELLKALFEHISEDQSYVYGFELMFGIMTANIDEETRDKSAQFHNNSWKAEAHVVACAYAIHAIIDIMAQVINCALDLKIAVNDVTINKVKKIVTKYHDLFKKLEELLDYDEYKYLLSFVNNQKHIFFVPVKYTFKMQVEEGEKAHGLKIPAFEYRGVDYPEKWSDDFVTTEFVKLKDKIIETGIGVNNILKAELG